MLNYSKSIEILISLQVIFISTMIPVFITLPFNYQDIQIFEIPTTWQIPSIIIISLIFNGEIVSKAFSIYLLVGLFLLPIFHQGGSLGYLLTPNFGYLLGIYPLIKVINDLNIRYRIIDIFNFLKAGILGVTVMHLIGIIYGFIQILYFRQANIFIYNISKYTLGKFGYHLLILLPITLLLRPINKIKNTK